MTPRAPYDFSDASFLPFKLGDKFWLRTTLCAGLLITLIYVIGAFLLIPSFTSFITVVTAMEGNPETAEFPVEFFTAYFRFLALCMVIGLFASGVMAASEAALHRKYQRGEDGGRFPLRIGMDEVFVFLLQIIVGLIAGAVFFVGYILIAILMLLVAVSAEAAPILAVIFGLLCFVIFIAMFLAMTYVAVRLSPASAMTVRDKEFRLFEAWKVTKDRVWPMIGSYIIVYLIGGFVINIIMGIFFLAVFLGSGIMGKVDQLEAIEDTSAALQAMSEMFLSPGMVITYVVFGFVYAVLMLLMKLCMAGIPSYALKNWELSGGGTESLATPYNRNP